MRIAFVSLIGRNYRERSLRRPKSLPFNGSICGRKIVQVRNAMWVLARRFLSLINLSYAASGPNGLNRLTTGPHGPHRESGIVKTLEYLVSIGDENNVNSYMYSENHLEPFQKMPDESDYRGDTN